MLLLFSNFEVVFFQQAKILEEMDSEFGIGSLIEEEFGTAKKQV